MKAFTVINAEQRSELWFAARAGRLTGSCAADMLATIKSGEAAACRDLRLRLVCERLTGQPQEDTFTNAAIQRGIDCEPLAIAAYEALTDSMVRQTGFLRHDTLPVGCSLDGHVGDFETIVSIKCPKSATHLGYVRGRVMPSAYVPQMLHELWITGAKAYDFLSWDDRLPEGLQTFYVRTLRDEKAIAEYEQKALAFLAEVATEVSALRTCYNLREVLTEATA